MHNVIQFPKTKTVRLEIQSDKLFRETVEFIEASQEARAVLGALLALELATSGDITPFQKILLNELDV